MPELNDTSNVHPSRRTILKASAWSLPVVAVAAATPLAAASVAEGDIQLVAQPGGSTIGATSPDGTQSFSLTLPPAFDVTTSGTTRTPENSTLIVSFDVRLLGDVTAAMEGVAAVPLSSDVVGNTQTVTFRLPLGIPANGVVESIQTTFNTVNDGVWVPDAVPYSVSVIAPTGSTDPNQANNIVTIASEYVAAP